MSTTSPLHQNLFDRLYTRHLRSAGPIARRTRSRTSPRFILPGYPPSRPPQSANTHPLAPSTLSPTHNIESGKFSRRRTTAFALQVYRRRLRLKRLTLKKMLESEKRFRDEEGYLLPYYQHKLRHFSRLTDDGGLRGVIKPQPATWASEKKMARKLHRRYWPSDLSQVERNWSEAELEQEFGILPGEERDEESDLWVEMDVEEGKTWEGRAMEDLLGGYCVGGVWREVLQPDKGEDVLKVEEWVKDRARLENMRGGEVMDRKCVLVVDGVWGMVEGR